MEIVLCLFYGLVFILIIRRAGFFKVEGLGRWFIATVFILKIFAGLLLWAVYTFYYTDRLSADIYKYFDDSRYMFEALKSNPADFLGMLSGLGDQSYYFTRYYLHMNNWDSPFYSSLYNDSHLMIRFNAIVRIFSFGYFNVHTVFMCFISLSGLTAVYKSFVPFIRDKSRELAAVIFLLPSVLFWSSGVLKEGFLFFSAGMLIYHVFCISAGRMSLRSLYWIVFSATLLAIVKFYVLISLLPGLTLFYILKKTSPRFVLAKAALVMTAYAAIGLNTHHFLPLHSPLEVLRMKQRDFVGLANGGTYLINDSLFAYISPENHDAVLPAGGGKFHIRQGSAYYYWKNNNTKDTIFVYASTDTVRYSLFSDHPRAGSVIKIPPLDGSFLDALGNTPSAILNSLFRPYPWEARSILLLLPVFENILVTAALIACIFFFRWKREISAPFLLCLSFVLILAAISGLVTPVLGALVRYRTPALPFLLITILFIFDKEKFLKKITMFSGKRKRTQEKEPVYFSAHAE